MDIRNRILKINLPPLVCKVLSYLDTRVAAEVEIKLGWVCYAGVNGGSRRNVTTCTTLKNENQENAETSIQSGSKKQWYVQAEQLCKWRSRTSDLFIIYRISSNKRPPPWLKYQTSAPPSPTFSSKKRPLPSPIRFFMVGIQRKPVSIVTLLITLCVNRVELRYVWWLPTGELNKRPSF